MPSPPPPSERSPLLKPDPAAELPSSPSSPSWRNIIRRPSSIRIALFLTLILVACGEELMESPHTRILESIICYRHYEASDPTAIRLGRDAIGPGALGGVSEALCKADPVQRSLAGLQGFQQTLDGVPALALAIPVGWAADVYGRRPVLCMGTFSLLLRAGWLQGVTWFWQAFDVRLTWLSTLHAVLGGGTIALTGPLYAMLSDVLGFEGRGLGTEFLRLNASSLLAAMLMRPVSAWLMRGDPWVPNLLGTVFMASAVVLSAFVPETLAFRRARQEREQQQQQQPAPVPAPAIDPDPTTVSPVKADDAPPKTPAWTVPALIMVFSIHTMLVRTTQLLLQYCSKRYALTLADASYLLALFSGGKFFLMFFILPYLSVVVKRVYHWTDQRKDLYFSRASLAVYVFGWTVVGLAPNVAIVAPALVVTSLGHGAFALTRSLVTSLISSGQVARVYGVIATMETLGSMVGGVGLAKLFEMGLRLGPEWIGLPFYVLGGLCAIFLAVVLAVRIKGPERPVGLQGAGEREESG